MAAVCCLACKLLLFNLLELRFNAKLPELSEMLSSASSVNEGGYSYDDIVLFPTLRRLTIVKGVKWPEKLRQYAEHMAEVCDVPLLDAMAL